jgi:hypothetical protein
MASMARITHVTLARAVQAVTAMSPAEKESLCDEIYRRQPNMLMSVIVQKTMGASLDQIEVLLNILMVCYEAMQRSGHAWPLITEEFQERCLKDFTAQVRSTERMAADKRKRAAAVAAAAHGEPLLLAYIQDQLTEGGISKMEDEGAKYIGLAAFNLANTIANVHKVR